MLSKGEFIRIDGLEELDKRLRALPDKINRDIMGKALEDGAEIIRAEAEANAPYDGSSMGHHLKDNIKLSDVKRRGSSTEIQVGIDYKKVKHGHLVEFGHGGPKPAPAHPFMRPAFDTKKGEALHAIRETLRRLIEGAARHV